jgi:hypothetical protein
VALDSPVALPRHAKKPDAIRRNPRHSKKKEPRQIKKTPRHSKKPHVIQKNLTSFKKPHVIPAQAGIQVCMHLQDSVLDWLRHELGFPPARE